jgi:hypothetical protein
MSDQEDLKALRLELQSLREAQSKPDVIDSSSKYIRWIQSVIGLVVLVVGLGINWGVTKAELTSVKAAAQAQSTQIEKLEGDILQLQLKQAGDDQLLKSMKEDLKEIRGDVKKILEAQ